MNNQTVCCDDTSQCVEVFLDQNSDDPVTIFTPGPPGPTGPAGPGVAVGGSTGQILSKRSNTNYDTQWVDNNSQNALIYALIFG